VIKRVRRLSCILGFGGGIILLKVMVSLPSLRFPPNKEPEAPALPPCPGLLFVQPKKKPGPPDQASPPSKASFPRKLCALRAHFTFMSMAIVGHSRPKQK
jgi:hypothetical protein